MRRIAKITITPGRVESEGKVTAEGFKNLTGLYRSLGLDYSKFFKMDGLCKLGFLAAEFLLKDLTAAEKENMGIVLFNRAGSLATDRNYQATLKEGEYFPSPAVFVYTLANIVTGEIAIRHKIYGETSFYILERPDQEQMRLLAETALASSANRYVLTGWVDFENENQYLAEMELKERQHLK